MRRTFHAALKLKNTERSKQIRVRAGAGKFQNKHVVFYLVNQKPVRADMQFAVELPLSFKGVVAVAFFERLGFCKFSDDGFQFRDVVVTAFCQFYIFFILRCPAD